MTTVQDLFDENIKFPSPPAIALKILEAVREEDNSFEDLAAIIKTDPSLSMRILKVSNSSLYGLRQPVDSLAQATSLIGTDTLKNIALSFVIVQDFKGSPQGSFEQDYFWRRAITSAVAADILGRTVGRKDQDLFVTALLQDIGVMILFLSLPDGYTSVLDNKRVNRTSLCETEEEQFSCDHTAVGYHLLHTWNLPESITQPIRFHHRPDEAEEEHRESAKILSFADKISAMYHGGRSNSKSSELYAGLAKNWKLDKEEIEKLVDVIGDKSRDILELFEIDPDKIKPFSQIMQDANEELGKLNFTYEQIVLELSQAKQNAEQLARELQQANNRLQQLADRDGLTCLYNHRYFQKVFEVELSRATRYNNPLSILLLDLDHFKKINDTHGHPAGDKVLKQISNTLVRLVRNCDTVARYGGEEFTVILPETGNKGAKVLAQRLRRGVEQEKIDHNGQNISVTMSIGVASNDISDTDHDRAALIELCDKALYKAKHNGRNRVEVASE